MKRLKFLETKRTPRYSLRKLNVGVASVLLGVTIFGINFTNHSVKAATTESVESFNSSANSNSQQTKGINAIGAVKVPDSQNDANKAIDAALNTKQSEINGATNIDQTTKDKLIKDATDAADKAKEAITKATTNNDVATEQTNTQKATSATGKVQQSSASNNATANNSTEATQTSSTKAKQTTQTATKNSDNTKVSSNTTNKENSQPTDKTTNTQVVSNIDKTLASLLTKLLATTPTTNNSASDSSTLPKSDQTVTKVPDPMMEDYKNRGGENTWIDQTVARGVWDYPSLAENAIFGNTGIIKTNPHKYFFAGYADFSEQYHRIILFARGKNASDPNLYTYVVHTYNDNVQPQTETPNETAPEIEYRGVLGLGGSTYNLQVHNYNGESFSVVLKGFKYGDQGGYGLTPIFDQGILNPKYKDKTLPELDGTSGINYKEQIARWASVIPQETTNSVRYVDLETGKDIAQPLKVTGYGYQGFKINGDAPKIDGYTLVSSPKTLGLSYEDGIIAPYEVGKTYTQYITDDVYVKQTVIDTNGTVRATAYYKGQPLGASASKILGHDDNNDSMSFTAGGQSYTYNNRINHVDGAMVYYYQKVGEEGKRSQLRVHYIDVTKDTDDSQYAPGDGVPATNSISGQEMNPQTYTGNIGDTYDYATNAKIPEGYVLVGTSPNIKGTFSKSDHDAYIYVKIDRNGAKATIQNLTHLNHAQKQAAEAAIDQATDLNTMNQATSTATTLDGDMGKLSDLTADLTNTNNYKYASDTPKSTVATDYTNADVLLDKTAGQNADDATVMKLIDQINTDKSSLDGDTNLSAAETTISGLTHLNHAQRSAANQAVTNASDLTGLKTAVANAQSVDSAMSDLQTAVNQANEAKTTNNYLQASANKQDNLNSAVQNAQAVLAATGANDSANQVKALTKSVNDAVDALDGDANTKKQADQNIDDVAKAAKQAIDNTNGITESEKQAAKGQVDADAQAAKQAIGQAKSNKAVTDAVNNGTVAIDKVSANAAIDGALKNKQSEINGANNLDQTTKDNLIKEATDAADAAKQAIDKATTADAIKTAHDDGISNINNVKVPSLTDSQTAAKDAIDDALKNKQSEINGANNLDQTTKDNLIKEATDAADAAKQAIDKATTADAIKTAHDDGISNINNVKVPSLTDSQTAAKDAIDDALKNKQSEINGANNLDQTTKDNLIKEATDAADAAKQAIDKATTADAIKTAHDDGVSNINNVKVPSLEDAKKAANQVVDNALTKKTNEINNASNLSDQEKQDLVNKATEAAKTAKDNIAKATTNDGATNEGQAGKTAIENFVPTSLEDAKKAANQVVDNALTKKTNEINNASNLSDQEKQDLVNKATEAAKTAKDNIAKATTNDGATNEGQAGKTAIENFVPTDSDVKKNAKDAIDQAAKTKDDAIDASSLTAEEKDALKKTVAGEVKTAKDNIDAATKDADVTTAKNTGVEKINNINVSTTSATKSAAKAAIDQAAKTKDDAIDASSLTAEEKDALKKTVAGEVKTAKDNIDAATKDADVTTAKNTGVEKINNINVSTTSATKSAAKAAIDQAAKTKDDAIDASSLTAEEKDALKKTVAGEVKTAKDNIDAATKDADVKTAQTNGEKAIKAVEIPTSSNTKNDANSDLDTTAAAAKKAIDETSGLTEDQKQTAKDQIDQAVAGAKENIKNASDNTGVAGATDAGKLAIDKVSAKAAIDAAVAAKKSEIAQAPLTAEEAKPLNNLVDQDADAAKAAIDAATTSAAVETAKNNGVETINNIKVPTTSATKDDANKAIDAVLAKKIEEINNANLTDDQKPSLIDQAQNAATQAKENIRNASTDEDVQTARNNGIAAIEEITVKSNSVDDQDNSATNAGDSSQTGHIQKDKFPEGTTVTVGDDGTATVTYPDGSKDVIAGTDLVIAPKSEDVLGSKYHSHKNGSNSSQADRVKGASTANGSIANAGNNLGVKAETDNAIVGVKGESDNAIGNNKATSLKTLPQTGTKDTSILGVLGMLLASLGLFVFKKKRDKE
ncbi:DUF1542 domain-containing protein [Lactobacillus sp. UMNPBX17]|uniref:DUF1542 domain-containing protein n=1 Tax=Lactobacillus sp. UMNPBX17 TaxID=2042030 RepID=UPI000BEF0688|nr:DUF1542 domain-containing protein [Lactobacillus sp. UMNPBX17]PEG80374.1 hypothetical protein CP368_07090 [Lactobacillus sp. UMNPBX17]